MTRFLNAAAKLAAIAALILSGSACCSAPTPIAYTGPWPDWQDIDEGGFEELGTVTWADAVSVEQAAAFIGAKSSGKNLVYGAATGPRFDFAFFQHRTGLARFCQPKVYIRLRLSGSVANRIVLDQAATSGGLVHVSGRQRSGFGPGGAYVEVTRVTPARKMPRIAY